jgi:two-component system, OmpR family, torCAD operon response regulator TorR
MLFGRANAPSIAAGNSRGLEQVVNVRSQGGALGDLSFQFGPQSHRTSNIVADSSGQELRVAGPERLIVVGDDPVTRTMLVGYFSENNFDVVGAGSCAECRQALRTRTDLVFLDVQLPDGDGFDLAKEIQATSNAGIIFVTRRDTDVDRILGLEVAGDHYVTKPIDLRDLLARARSVLRRRSIDRKAARNHNSIAFGDWIIDLTRRELLGSDGKPVALTRAEFDLLAALVGADGRPLSRDYLIEVVSNRQAEVDIRTVDALVARLRRKLVGSGTPVITTVTGVGYKLALSERL